METQMARISYDHTKTDDKHFFGGYLNLAYNNIESVISVYRDKFGPKNKELQLSQFANACFKDTDSDADFQKKFRFIQMHFPVISYLQKEGNRSALRSNFSLLLNAISDLRNFYTHYYHKPLEFPNELFMLLDFVFAKVAHEVKQHKMKDDKTRHLLSKNLSEELEIRYQQQLERLKELKDQGKKINLSDTAGIKNGVLNNAFSHLIFKDGENFKPTLSYSSYYHGADSGENGITISQSGLLFLLSMFLNKRETENLKSRVRGFKAKIIKSEENQISGLKFMATHWVFSYLSFKGVKQRLNVDFHEETLLIQIIDELSKVPDELYQSFDEETRKSFIEDINEYMKEGKEDLSLEESKVVHPVIRKRYENKFNYFAIRFLDEFMAFPSLRFQVHVGNYVHDRRVKNITGTGFQTERVVKDRIKVFGKLTEINNLKADYIEKELKLSDETGWELLPNPSYVFIENNIPIYLSMDKGFKKGINDFRNRRKAQKPEEMKTRNQEKIRKDQITGIIGNKDELNPGQPVAVLSLNEIPALLYEILINGASPSEIENTIQDKLNAAFERIKDYDPKSPVPASQISKRLRKNKGIRSIDQEKLIHLIKREVGCTEAKLSLIDNNRKECRQRLKGKLIRERVFRNSEMGREATWIAEDIKRFMPAIQRQNWKGYQHAQFQQSLAFFEKRPGEARSILMEGWDFEDGSSLWNGWIMNSFTKNRSFDVFYEFYLKKRKEYFVQLLENIKQYSSNVKFLVKFVEQQMPKGLFDKRHFVLEDLETEKNKILSKPLVFPRGIFDNKPTFIKGKKVTEEPELFANWYQYGYDTSHKFQKFYDWERSYEKLLEDKLNEDTEFTKKSLEYSRPDQLALLKLKQDLKIKKIKIEDLFLKLMAEHLFKKVFDYDTELTLSDFFLTQEERLQKEKEAAQQNQRQAGDDSPNIIKDDFIWSKTLAYEKGQIYESSVKLKDFGKFSAYISDEKVKSLLAYDESKKWNKLELEKELSIGSKSYESIRREQLFKQIQELEKKILTNWNWDNINHPVDFEVVEKNGTRHPNFKLYIVNGILRKNNVAFNQGDDRWIEDLNENHFKNLLKKDLAEKSEIIQIAFLIILIRNQFAHNRLPALQFYEFICEKFPEIKGETASEIYFNFVKEMILRLIGI